MNRCFLTSDCHGQFWHIRDFCYKNKTTLEDYLLILGDVGLNYHLNPQIDSLNKKYVSTLPITLLCIHGNHEERAYNISTYKRIFISEIEAYGYVEKEYPNIIFIEDGVFFLAPRTDG